MIITYDEDNGVVSLRKTSIKEEPYDSIHIEDLVEIWQKSTADTPQTEDYDFRDEQEYNDRWQTDCGWK